PGDMAGKLTRNEEIAQERDLGVAKYDALQAAPDVGRRPAMPLQVALELSIAVNRADLDGGEKQQVAGDIRHARCLDPAHEPLEDEMDNAQRIVGETQRDEDLR